MNEPKWRRYLRIVRPNPVGDLDDELRDHLESTTEALIAGGLAPEAARAEALRRFGDVARVRSQVHRLDARHAVSTHRVAALETFLYDLRHAARGLRRSPAFAFVAAISIGLGVAANATVFSLVNAALLRPIPGTSAERLMRMYVNHHSPFDWRDLSWFRANARSFDHIVGERYGAIGLRATPGADAERVRMSYITHGYFPMFGVRMAIGRAFDDDEAAGAAPVAVLTYAFWQRRFAGDSSVIGKTVTVAEHPVTIVGVTDAGFHSSVVGWAPDLFVPFSAATILTGRRLDEFGGSFYATTQLRAGVSADAAQSELRVLMVQLARTDSARYERITVRLDHIRGVNAEMRQAAIAGSAFLMAMVGMVLLIACANVANLLLGRAAARRTEIGVRLAIGASRGRLVRQLLTESFLLAALGSTAGFAIAWMLTRTVPAVIPSDAGIDAAFFAPDGRVLLFTGLLCVVTTVLFGVVPALRAASPNLVGLIKGNDAHDARTRRRGWLVALQTAMCVLLLAVASIFVRSLASMRAVDPGFRADGVVDATIDLGLLGVGVNREQTFASIVKGASAIPGVLGASLIAMVPLTGGNMETRILPAERTAASRSDASSTYFNIVSPSYFAMMRIPLRRGREFATTDVAGSPRVAVISETAARRFWPDGDALGKRFHWGSFDGPLVEIVGISRDADYVMPGEDPKPVVYVPLAQEMRDEMTLQVRTAASVATARRAIWDLLRTTVPTLPPPPVARLADDMAITLLPVQIGAALLGAFGGLALLLAAAGIYGVASYSVARRTREIGIRAALGASRGMLLRMVLSESGRRVGIGAAIGLVATVGIGVAMSRVLYGVHPFDPVVLVSVTLIVAAVAVLATIAPARRAAGADPVSAMRAE